jgi:hypothetical protein
MSDKASDPLPSLPQSLSMDPRFSFRSPRSHEKEREYYREARVRRSLKLGLSPKRGRLVRSWRNSGPISSVSSFSRSMSTHPRLCPLDDTTADPA